MNRSEASEWLRDRKLETDGEYITYSRKGVSLDQFKAVPGRTPFRTSDQEGKTMIVRSDRDFLFDPAVLETFGEPEPLEGDKIVWDDETFEVWPVVVGEPCWQPCDDYGHMIRVHTRKVT